MSDTYLSTADHVFTRVAAIRTRALALLEGIGGTLGAPDEGAGVDVAAERRAEADAIELRLPALTRRFGLTSLEEEALVCLVAAEYDPVVRTLERALQREVGRPWMEVGTLAELLGLPADRVPELARSLYPDAPFRRWALVHSDDPSASELPAVFTRLKIASRVAQHLIGHDHLPQGVRLRDPARPLLDRSLVAQAVTSMTLTRLLRARTQGEPLVVEISGVPGTGRRDYAEGLANALGMPLVLCDLDEQVTDDRTSRIEERIAVARREAALAGALLGLSGWAPRSSDTPAQADEAHGPPRSAERRLARAVERLCGKPDDVMFLFSEEREALLGRAAPLLVNVQVPFPTPGQRASLLESAITRMGGRIDPSIDVQNLARRFALDPARIEVAARAARELAAERGDDPLIDASDLHEACRHQLSHDLKSLAQRVTNSHKWEDLVIPVDVYHSLKEMISYVRHAERVYDSWGFGARHSLAQGVSALFAGPPGTGKTMCASVMARELDMELFRVDLSRIVSKWIGETEKNLGKVFNEAARSNAIILFDEADALFAKRTEVKSSVDRYANLEINFLLQRMEAFSGVTILTTNYEDTIDTAFKRRLTFRMRFEKPDADARAALWTKIFPRDADVAADVDATELGALYELAGGNIRNAAVRAAFLAAEAGTSIDHRTCMLAAEREAREMGLLVRSHIEATPVVSLEEPPEREATFTNLAQPEAAPTGRSRVVPVTRPRRQS